MDFDNLLPEIGEFGTYQKLVMWFLLVPGVIPCGFHAYNMIFMMMVPDHWCKGQNLTEMFPNASSHIIKTLSIPYDNLTKKFEKCSKYDLEFTDLFTEFFAEDFVLNEEKLAYVRLLQVDAKVIPCDQGWQYDLDDQTTSIVSDWDLVCEKKFLPTLALVLFGLSGLIGSFIFGFIQDGLGRRPAFFLYLLILCFFGLATSYVPNFWWWLACRIGVGFTIPSILATPMILSIELVGPSYRTYTSIVMNIAYSCTLILLSIIVYFVRLWPQLSLATVIPLLGFFGFWWVLPESPRWLLAKRKKKEAYKIMATMARINKRPLKSDFLHCLKDEVEEKTENLSCVEKETNAGISDLFRTRNLRKKTIILTFIWFTNTLVYVGLSYYAPALGGDSYLNFFLGAVSELPTYIFLWPSMEYWGRRWTLCISMTIGGVSCIATVLTQNDQTTTLILYCIGKFGISSSYVVLPLMASELYPTVVRGIGLGLSSTAGMIGPVIIPLINYLGTEILVLPLIIMGVFLIFGGFSALLLPETLHQHLPQTIEEGEGFGQNMAFQDYLNCCPRRRLNLQTQEIPQTNEEVEKLTEFKEKFQPTLCEDIVEESNYSSLRRNSFKIAQIEAISFEEQGRSHSMNNGSRDQTKNKAKKSKKSMNNVSGDQTKKKTKNSKKSGCMESYFKNGHELLLQTPKRVTVI